MDIQDLNDGLRYSISTTMSIDMTFRSLENLGLLDVIAYPKTWKRGGLLKEDHET